MIRGITILFENNLEEDYVENLEKAILMFRGIAKIERDVDSPDKWITESKLRMEMHEKLFNAIYKKD